MTPSALIIAAEDCDYHRVNTHIYKVGSSMNAWDIYGSFVVVY